MSIIGERSEGGGGGSEYKNRYREHDVQPRLAPYRPEAVPVAGDAAMETSTTSKRDYIEHPVQRQQAVKPSDNNLRAEGDHDFTSSYNNTFLGRTGERTLPIRRDQERQQLDRFVGEPTYKAEYREWTLPPRGRRETEKWVPPKDKFDARTTNHKDYTEHMLTPRQTIKRAEEWSAPDGPFDDTTGYKDSFKEYPVQPRRPRQRQLWTQPAVKFNHQTIKQSDFTGPYQPKRESCRPNRNAFMSDAPFDGSTTSHADYQEKPLGERYVHGSERYVKPEGAMDLSTTNQNHFREFPLSRHAIERPGSSHILRGTGPMAQESGYNADFVEHHSPRREMLKPKANYQPPTDKFGGQSTAKGDYVEKQISPRETYRPRWEPVSSDAKFETSTENRSSFVEKPLQPRLRREQETYVGPSVPFQASTTNKESYLGEFVPKRSSCKPDQTTIASDAKFDGRTTFKNDFQEHRVSPRFRHEHEKYVKPDGDMDLRTTNQENFRDMGRSHRHVITKPSSSHLLRGEGKFADGSSYMGDFAAPPAQARQLVRPKNDYQPTGGRFEGISTQKASFTGPYAPKQASFRPPNRPLQNLNAFEDNTGYRQDYQSWHDATRQVPPISG